MKKNKKWGGSFKYLIPGIIAVVILSAVFLNNNFLSKHNLGSVYGINELQNNFSKVKAGDTINYEINGYSDWEVLYTDIDNGTIDVVSKTNTEDLTLEPNQTKENYENKFQETANKYTDGNYAISARTVNQGDLDNISFDNDFWLNNVNEDTITTSKGSWKFNIKNHKIYVIPCITISGITYYNIGDIIEYQNNGVNRWNIIEIRQDGGGREFIYTLIPETPIELTVDSIHDDINSKYNDILNSFGASDYFNNYSQDNLLNFIPNFLNQQTDKIWFYRNSLCPSVEENSLNSGWCNSIIYYQNGAFNSNSNQTLYTDVSPKTLGYRPVVTLKVNETTEGKDISTDLKVGDNVKYEAKGYKNWKVFKVDKDNNTVDIISGGIVKNITLSGREDWENYEDIIQGEIDNYKSGENVVGTRFIDTYDIKLLEQSRDKVNAKYFINSKKLFNSRTCSYGNCDAILHSISMSYFEDEIQISKVYIYIDTNGNDENYKDYYGQTGKLSYTAGLRPIITLKLNNVEKLDENESSVIDTSTQKEEKQMIKEQESKNQNYKISYISDNSSSNTGNSRSDNNNQDNTSNNNSKNENVVDSKNIDSNNNTNTTNNKTTNTTTNNYITNNKRPKIIDYLLIILVSINIVISVLTFIKLKRKH